MSFTDQKSRIATEEDVKAPWSGGKNGKYFRCKLCGHKFEVGDQWRWIYHRFGNFIVCEKCDGPDVEEKWQQAHEDWEKMHTSGPFWWLIAQLEREAKDATYDAALSERESRKDVEYWRDRALSGEDRR